MRRMTEEKMMEVNGGKKKYRCYECGSVQRSKLGMVVHTLLTGHRLYNTI